jgi:hypothetical protein
MLCITNTVTLQWAGVAQTDCGLDDPGSIQGKGKGFFFCPLLSGSGAHPASNPMGTGGSFLGGKARPGRGADHSPQSSVEVKNE